MPTRRCFPALAIAAAMAGCVPAPTVESLAAAGPATTHDFDGRYIGTGRVRNGATCGNGYYPAAWTVSMLVGGNHFELRPFAAGASIKGDVSDAGDISTRRGRLGRIIDGRFRGGTDRGDGCKLNFDLTRQ